MPMTPADAARLEKYSYENRAAKRLAKAVKNRAERVARQAVESFKPPAHEVPIYCPEKLALQRIDDRGTVLVQQTHKFGIDGHYIGEVPLAEAYITTPEMERNHERDRAKWRAKTRLSSQFARPAAIPEAILKIGAENAQALLAERLAE